jgi:hypothetical protein
VTVRVTDQGGLFDEKTFTLIVHQQGGGPNGPGATIYTGQTKVGLQHVLKESYRQ